MTSRAKRIAVVLVALAAGIVVVGITGRWFIKRSADYLCSHDAVYMIAHQVNAIYEKSSDSPQEEINQAILWLHTNGVIGRTHLAPNGKVTDPYGTPFRVEHRTDRGRSVTTATSAGPDRQFGTTDDIRRTAASEDKPPAGNNP